MSEDLRRKQFEEALEVSNFLFMGQDAHNVEITKLSVPVCLEDIEGDVEPREIDLAIHRMYYSPIRLRR